MKRLSVIPVFLLAFSWMSGQNVNISNYLFTDTEVSLGVNPANPSNLVAAWIRAENVGQAGIGVAYSTDAGSTWSTPQFMPHLYSHFTSADPTITYSSSGEAYLGYIDYVSSHDSGYVVITKSNNLGATWSAPVRVISGFETTDKPIDRPWIVCDASGGTYDGRLYVVTKNVDDPGTVNHVFFKYSDDSGQTWTPLDTIDTAIPADLTRTMGALAVGADGSVNVAYFSWHLAMSFNLRVILARSTDGGDNFSHSVITQATTGSPINDTLQFGNTLVANPADANNLAFIFTDARFGDSDILCVRSTDAGTTWSSSPMVVNDDMGMTTNHQDMSWAGYSPSGTLVVAWRDRRNGGTSAVSPFELFSAISTDGGASFDYSMNQSDAPSPDIAMQKGNDFIGVAVSNDYLFAAWADRRTGNNEIFFTRDSSGLPSAIDAGVIAQPSVICHPNPFTEEIEFEVNLPSEIRSASVSVFDSQGKQIKILHQGTMVPGRTSFRFSGNGMAAGTYFFRLRSDEISLEKAFVKK